MATSAAGPLTESISRESNASGAHSDYWSHMERVSTFKKAEHHHKLTPAEQELMESYESLDFEHCENELYRDYMKNEPREERRKRHIIQWAIYCVIGLCTGSTAFFSAVMVETLNELKFSYIYDAMPKPSGDGSLMGAYIIDVFFCMMFVGFAAILVVCVEPAAAGSGIPEAKAYLNGSNVRRYLSPAALMCKATGVSFAVSGGLCVGKEGPLVHVGSAFAAILSHGWDKASKHFIKFRNDVDKRDFISAGCAAGVAAAFGAPIGGVLFSLEEASSFWTVPLLWKVFFSAMCSTFTLNILLSWHRCEESECSGISDPGLITFGSFGANSSYKVWELPMFVIIAVIGGLLGALFNELNIRLTAWRRDNVAGNTAKLLAEAVFVGWLSATCFFWLPYISSSFIQDECRQPDRHESAHHVDELFQNYSSCNETEYNEMASLSFTAGEKTIHALFHSHNHLDTAVFSPATLLLYLLVYFFLAVLTYGVKVPSGLFVPGIICGSTFGRFVGEIAKSSVYDSEHGDTCVGDTDVKYQNELFTSCEQAFQQINDFEGHEKAVEWCQTDPDAVTCEYNTQVCVDSNGFASENCVFPGTYALIGAASMLGGVTRMTVSLTVILLETTQDIQYLLPIMTVLIVSKWVGDFFNISLYDMHVEFKCIPFVEDLPPTGMEHLLAADVMSTNLVTFAEIEPAQEVYSRLCSCKHNGFPVVSEEGKISGLILRSHLVKALKKGAFCSSEGVPIAGKQQLTHDDLAVTLESEIEDVNKLMNDGELFNESEYLDLRPVMNPWPYVVYEGASLSRQVTHRSITQCLLPLFTPVLQIDLTSMPGILLSVYRLYRGIGIRHLPVIDINNKVVGILCRKELRTDWKGDSLV